MKARTTIHHVGPHRYIVVTPTFTAKPYRHPNTNTVVIPMDAIVGHTRTRIGAHLERLRQQRQADRLHSPQRSTR